METNHTDLPYFSLATPDEKLFITSSEKESIVWEAGTWKVIFDDGTRFITLYGPNRVA